jgi:hypothetical protein
MSESQLKTDFAEITGGAHLDSEPALVDAGAAAVAASNDTRMRSARRRMDNARLLFSGDDGFHLFRVY